MEIVGPGLQIFQIVAGDGGRHDYNGIRGGLGFLRGGFRCVGSGGGGGGRGGLLGASVAAAGEQAQNHYADQQHGNELFHFCFLLVFKLRLQPSEKRNSFSTLQPL